LFYNLKLVRSVAFTTPLLLGAPSLRAIITHILQEAELSLLHWTLSKRIICSRTNASFWNTRLDLETRIRGH